MKSGNIFEVCRQPQVQKLNTWLFLSFSCPKRRSLLINQCGSPQRVIGADTLSFNAKVDLVNF